MRGVKIRYTRRMSERGVTMSERGVTMSERGVTLRNAARKAARLSNAVALALALFAGAGMAESVTPESVTVTESVTPESVTPESATTESKGALPLQELRVFADVFGKIKSDYIDPADDATLLRDAVHGMLAGLDPHSSFLAPDEFEDMRISTEGKFGGLGIDIVTEDGFIKVVAPIDDTPAMRAGILPGDIITHLDGAPASGMELRDAIGGLRGAPGSEVVLTISREGARQGVREEFDVKLVRALITVASVKSELLEPDFGYLRITRFQTGTGASLRENIASLARENGRALKGIALDLRNNPGGVLQGAIEVSDVFLAEGIIVSTRSRRERTDYNAGSPDLTGDAPLVVLVNGGSASAAEIVAGALQDHKRAMILGGKTFGKGSVQSVIPIENGGALKLTTARYYTPLQRSIQARGIMPDIIVTANARAPRDEREELSEADLAGHLENEQDGSAQSGKAARKSKLPARDFQLSEALNLLKGMSLVKARDAGAKLDSDADGAGLNAAPGPG